MKFANFLKIFLKILVKIQLKKVIIYKSILENSKKDEPVRANFAAFANALCYLNATPLSVVVLAPCAWGENLACSVAWQSALLGCNGAWQSVMNLAKHNTAWRGEFSNETAQHSKIQWHSKASKAKMGLCLGGGLLSLSLSLVSQLFICNLFF